MKEHPTIWL